MERSIDLPLPKGAGRLGASLVVSPVTRDGFGCLEIRIIRIRIRLKRKCGIRIRIRIESGWRNGSIRIRLGKTNSDSDIRIPIGFG
jgi:hypothetical protein